MDKDTKFSLAAVVTQVGENETEPKFGDGKAIILKGAKVPERVIEEIATKTQEELIELGVKGIEGIEEQLPEQGKQKREIEEKLDRNNRDIIPPRWTDKNKDDRGMDR